MTIELRVVVTSALVQVMFVCLSGTPKLMHDVHYCCLSFGLCYLEMVEKPRLQATYALSIVTVTSSIFIYEM